MKRKHIIITACSILVLLICVASVANALLSNFIDNTNIVCKDQNFSSAEEAIQALEINAREENDKSLDYCPPYNLLYSFNYEKNTIVLYSYCHSFDGAQSASYAIRVLKHNDDGTLSFDSGFADFYLKEPGENENYYYYTNIKTSNGNESISFLYLDKDSEKDIYVDGRKAEKLLVSTENREFYICYAISDRDTFMSNLFVSISDRHRIEIK